MHGIYSQNFILALDQGVTSSRAALFDASGNLRGLWQEPIKTSYPKPGFVEQDPTEIAHSQILAAKKAMAGARVSEREIAAIGIASQTATCLAWERETGKPVTPAIVWQCRRSAADCRELAGEGLEPIVFEKTGLKLDASFSATRLPWMFREVFGLRRRMERGQICFGSIDAWLLWKLTEGREFKTDASGASRTMLMNLKRGAWDIALLERFGVPESALPEIEASSTLFGFTDKRIFGREIPIGGLIGDQQASLFGQACMRKGQAKLTLGTGAFLWCCTGEKPIWSKNGLLSTVAWNLEDHTTYALEGFVTPAGSALEWLKEELGLFEYSEELERLAGKARTSEGVIFVPAFTGLGAPYWRPDARGAIFGLTRGAGGRHIARAALEAIACQTRAAMNALQKDLRRVSHTVRVDGGVAANALLLQLVADMTRRNIERSAIQQSSAFGAAMMAGLAVGFWGSIAEIQKLYRADLTVKPSLAKKQTESVWEQWNRAVKRLGENGVG